MAGSAVTLHPPVVVLVLVRADAPFLFCFFLLLLFPQPLNGRKGCIPTLPTVFCYSLISTACRCVGLVINAHEHLVCL